MRFTRKEKSILEAALSLLYWQEYKRLTNATDDAVVQRSENRITDINKLKMKIIEGQEHGESGDVE